MTGADQVAQRAAVEVEDYIVISKGWEKGTFKVALNRMDGATLVFWVLHSDDRSSNVPGTGKSVEVYFDPVSNRVLKELAFQ